MSVTQVNLYDSRGRIRPIGMDRWAIYAAFSEGDAGGLVKIGVSSLPLARAASIHQGAQFGLDAFLWAWASTKAQTYQLEGMLHRAFASRHLKGEWFRFDFANPDDKREFHDVTKSLFLAMTGRPLAWTKSDLTAVREFALAKVATRQASRPKKPAPRPKPWQWKAVERAKQEAEKDA